VNTLTIQSKKAVKVSNPLEDFGIATNLLNHENSFVLELSKGKKVILFGAFFYFIDKKKSKPIVNNDSQVLKKLFNDHSLADLIPKLEGQYVGMLIDSVKEQVQLFSDRYARLDLYYSLSQNKLLIATELDFIFKHTQPQYDQKMLVHFFSVYGNYVPKGHTLYQNVKRLKIGEILTFKKGAITSEVISFVPQKIEEYQDKKLEDYYQILKNSIHSRINNKNDVWVSSSSGWDSSIILGMLVDELGPKKVNMITGSMKYSKQAEIINQFELDKIKSIGKFYGIKPKIVSLDYESEDALKDYQRLQSFYRSKHLYSFTVFNFSRIAEGLPSKGVTIFNGETSDSFHNFGFSQFVTFFHTIKSFTEYGDKMNNYLYSPHFFQKIIKGDYEKDKVFQIFQKMMPGVNFENNFKNKEDLLERYLFPLFYGGPRVPFVKTEVNPLLTSKAQKKILTFPFREFQPQALNSLNQDNLYSWFIHLYHHFHSQGSTVNAHKYPLEKNGHSWRMPFNDYQMIDFLSKAPESWGRGLDFNHTKHPLKWVAQNKIKFPYELLQKGPHSYLYDVIEGFSLQAEIVYRSHLAGYFKKVLAEKPYKKILDPEYFDLTYLDNMVNDYVSGKEVKDLNNLVSLVNLCTVGWY